MIKKLSEKIKFSHELAAIILIFALVPTIALALFLIGNTRSISVQNRMNDIDTNLKQLNVQLEKTVQACNLSSQVFLNTPALINHLERLENGEDIPADELLSFYRNDIASLEKIVIGNPNLKYIRAYSVVDKINEMIPILYSSSRMSTLSWYSEESSNGTWHMDFNDKLYPTSAETHHLMSLITNMTGTDGVKIGVLEVALSMEDVFPELYHANENQWSCIIDENENIYYGIENTKYFEYVDNLNYTSFQDEIEINEIKLGGKPVIFSAIKLKDLKSVYIRFDDITQITSSASNRILWYIILIFVVVIIVFIVINMLTKRLLKRIYDIFSNVEEFSNGNLDTKIEINRHDEIGKFALSVNDMLDKIRQLMSDNLEREMLNKNTEIRALQNQINAHFIYNVLESIKMMAEIDEKYEIADALTSLGKLLRYGMKWTNASVSVQDELIYIENYLVLMNLRFDYTLSLKLDLPTDLLYVQIPKLSLQPIIENAVIHGASELDCDTEILVSGKIMDNKCFISITDFGKGMTKEQTDLLRKKISGEVINSDKFSKLGSGNSIGLKNVEDRIHMTFGNEYGLKVSSIDGEYTTVTVNLPYKKATDETTKKG